ncbi:MAG: RHS repeat-associated core domain-containing protein [Thermoleophilia bacterium]
MGNRLSLEHPAIGQTTYSYNQANQLIQQVNWPDPTNFTYNANGALTQKTKGSDITTYSYNGMDKLTSVETPSTTVNYAYDALGRRIKRSEGTGTKNFHLSGKSDLEDYRTNQNGDLTASMQRGPDGMFLYTNYSGGQSYGYQLPNPHGDNTLITDETGAQVYSDHYDSFGNSTIGGDLGYGYTGKWQRDTDYATGTVRMGVREHDPVVGRFASADPLKGDAMNPQMRNRYPYVGNNPMSRYDLNGLWYFDVNINYPIIRGAGITFGAMLNDEGFSPYAGGGLMTGGVSVTGSLSEPSPGLNTGIQGGHHCGGQLGYSHKGPYWEVGYVEGASYTDFFVWGPINWPSDSNKYNSNNLDDDQQFPWSQMLGIDYRRDNNNNNNIIFTTYNLDD